MLPAALPFTRVVARQLPFAYRAAGRTCRSFSPIGALTLALTLTLTLALTLTLTLALTPTPNQARAPPGCVEARTPA